MKCAQLLRWEIVPYRFDVREQLKHIAAMSEAGIHAPDAVISSGSWCVVTEHCPWLSRDGQRKCTLPLGRGCVGPN